MVDYWKQSSFEAEHLKGILKENANQENRRFKLITTEEKTKFALVLYSIWNSRRYKNSLWVVAYICGTSFIIGMIYLILQHKIIPANHLKFIHLLTEIQIYGGLTLLMYGMFIHWPMILILANTDYFVLDVSSPEAFRFKNEKLLFPATDKKIAKAFKMLEKYQIEY
ncbi:hypothetical protein ACW95P_00060 [Candidatus Mycoplasma pogonae]